MPQGTNRAFRRQDDSISTPVKSIRQTRCFCYRHLNRSQRKYNMLSLLSLLQQRHPDRLLAKVKTSIRATPAECRTLLHSFTVLPVVNTSSIRSTRFPATLDTSARPKTFFRLPRRSFPARRDWGMVERRRSNRPVSILFFHCGKHPLAMTTA